MINNKNDYRLYIYIYIYNKSKTLENFISSN